MRDNLRPISSSSGRDAPEVLQSVQRRLDAPARILEALVEGERLFPIAPIWNDRFGAALDQLLAQFGAVISPRRRACTSTGFTLRIKRSASGQSCAWPPVNRTAISRPLESASERHLVFRPPPTANSPLLLPPSPPAAERWALMCVRSPSSACFRSSIPSKLPEQIFPDAAPGPADKSVIDRGRWSILGRAIAPATTAFQYLHNAADDAAIIGSFDTAYVRRQVRFDPLPLLIAQPK